MSTTAKTSPSPARSRVALVEDDEPYRLYLETLIAAAAGWEVAAAADSAEAALAWPDSLAPEVMLLDVALPGRSGPSVVTELLARWPKLKIIMLTGRDGDEPLIEAIRAGAAGYLLKSAASSEIIEALADARAGGAPMSPPIARRVLTILRETPATKAAGAPSGGLSALTEREREVLALIADGCADKEVCQRLGITRSTVKNHLTAIYDKWRVRSRTQAAVRFVKITGG